MKKNILFLFVNISLIYSQSIDSLKQVLRQADDQTKVRTMLLLSDHFFYSKPDSALIYLQKGIELTRQNHFLKYEIKLMNSLGVFYNEKGDYKKARQILDQTYELATQSKDTLSMVAALGNLGNISLHLGKFDEAIDYFTRVAGMYQKLGNIKGMAKVYGAIGNMYKEMNNNDKALDYYKRSQERFWQNNSNLKINN